MKIWGPKKQGKEGQEWSVKDSGMQTLGLADYFLEGKQNNNTLKTLDDQKLKMVVAVRQSLKETLFELSSQNSFSGGRKVAPGMFALHFALENAPGLSPWRQPQPIA